MVEGAAVRVSLVCFANNPALPIALDGMPVAEVFADLTAVQNLVSAAPLPENSLCAFNGIQKTGPFEIPGDLARQWLRISGNPHGRPNSEVLAPCRNGIDTTRRVRDAWIVDFGWSTTADEAAFYELPFGHLTQHVWPVREQNSLKALRDNWWCFWRPRPSMRAALASLQRYFVTPEVSKHRVFDWLPLPVLSDKNLIVIARDDDTTFGILHSRFHELWALALSTWLGVGNDPRYTPSTTFETFPFPDGLTPNIPAAQYATDPRAIAQAARNLTQLRDRWLNPPELVNIVPEVVPGYPDRLIPKSVEAAAELKKRTLTNLYNDKPAWLRTAHAQLDSADAAAYGWPADLPDDEILRRLLALNPARAMAANQPTLP